MTLEWLRRHDPKLDAVLRTYLFAEGSIVGRGGRRQAGGQRWRRRAGDGSLGIGSLKR